MTSAILFSLSQTLPRRHTKFIFIAIYGAASRAVRARTAVRA